MISSFPKWTAGNSYVAGAINFYSYGDDHQDLKITLILRPIDSQPLRNWKHTLCDFFSSLTLGDMDLDLP
jgi:hypothetical protein